MVLIEKVKLEDLFGPLNKTEKKNTRFLVEREIIVVSGLAEGIDTVAHRTAIDAGGKTIAVLGTPLEKFASSAESVGQG